MDCNKAHEAMMQYMDKKIKPAAAAALARHVLKCVDCRERFLLFDAAMDVAMEMTMDTASGLAKDTATAVVTAPAGFTEAVMASVNKLPPHERHNHETQKRNAPAATSSTWRLDMTTRVIAGVCVILLGVALMLTYNHEALSTAMAGNTTLYAVVNALGVTVRFFDHSFNWLIQASSQVTGLVSEVGYMSLALVLMSGAILFVMQRGERLEHE